MKVSRFWLIACSFLLALSFTATAQKSKTKKPVTKTTTEKTKPAAQQKQQPAPVKKETNVAEDEKRIRDIIAFLEYIINTLGSSETSARDKEVLVSQSYSKIFRDAKVQVEDDLDDDRKVITNKDVVAYLKDIDFFYKDVRFEFIVETIQRGSVTQGNTFYKVSLRRNLKGTTSEGVPVSNSQPRYIEINYDGQQQDLKIVSMYTHVFNEKEAMANWWKDLSYEWQAIFKRQLNLVDSVSFDQIKRIVAIDALDLHGNKYMQSLEPLSQLTKLKKLDISYTQVEDLMPIRNLTELTELNASHTPVADLSALKYSSNLQKLNVSYTQVQDIGVLEKMPALTTVDLTKTNVTSLASLASLPALRELSVKGTRASDFMPLENLVQLADLNVSQTLIQDLASLKNLKNLITLNIDSTRIRTLTPLSGAENLKVLMANSTAITELQPLQKLKNLEKIYIDHTPVTRTVADAFMRTNPKVLIIVNSRDWEAWWAGLPDQWKEVIGRAANFGLTPAKEELARITSIDSVNFSGNQYIKDLEPLRRLQNVRVVVATGSGITSLTGLQDQKQITHLDISETGVSDLTQLIRFEKLQVLRADKTKVDKLEPLYGIATLKKLYVDETPIHDLHVQEFLEKNPKCLVVHKTIHLKRWWGTLPPDWKSVFQKQLGADTTVTREKLHALVEQPSLEVKDVNVSDFTFLHEFVRLQSLHCSGTAITDITPLANFSFLKSLHVVNSPLQKIETLSKLTGLEDLSISNTPVTDIAPVASLTELTKLDCSGTQVKRLDPLQKLQKLEYFDCSNTPVTKLDDLLALPLKTLKCYNTKISTRKIESFKVSNPSCQVIYYR